MAQTNGTSIIQLLDAARQDHDSAPELLAQVYGQLRAVAQNYLRAAGPQQTLEATAVVHEAYMRLVGGGEFQWDSPAHFFAAASAAMRSVLIDHARARGRLKRGGDRKRVAFSEPLVREQADEAEFLHLDNAIQRLVAIEPDLAHVVRLRFYVGFNNAETAQALGVSVPTAKRRWQLARAWLFREIGRVSSG